MLRSSNGEDTIAGELQFDQRLELANAEFDSQMTLNGKRYGSEETTDKPRGGRQVSQLA
jgi:hypothetical protein